MKTMKNDGSGPESPRHFSSASLMTAALIAAGVTYHPNAREASRHVARECPARLSQEPRVGGQAPPRRLGEQPRRPRDQQPSNRRIGASEPAAPTASTTTPAPNATARAMRWCVTKIPGNTA